MASDPIISSPLATAGTKVNPLALSVTELARMLAAAGGKKVTPEQVQADLDAGAPVGRDGRVNLIHYAAWLAREVQSQ